MPNGRIFSVILCSLCILAPASALAAAEQGGPGIPAKLAFTSLEVRTATLQLSERESKNIVGALSTLFRRQAERLLREQGRFLKIVPISEQALPSSASVAEIAQSCREADADVVLVGTIMEFTGTIAYGFRPSLREHMAIEVVLYEAATNRRLWHGKEVVDVSTAAPVTSWSNDRMEKKYLALAEEETFPAAFSALLAKIGKDLADYRPPVVDKLAAAAAADFIADVDRVPRTARDVRRNAFAVVIGIENYRDLHAAEFTTRDAKVMKEYLVRVMGFPQENVITLLNERATRGDIEGYVGSWLKKSAGRSSQVVVYYAGHGAPNPASGEPFLIPYDGNPAFLEDTAIPLRRLYQMLGALEAKEVLLIMDSCFSGGGGRSVMPKGGRPVALSIENPVLASKNIVVLSASKGSEISSSYPEKRHGLFTYYLLKGLQGEADLTGDRSISIDELYNYVVPQVKRTARESMREQTPTCTPDIDVLGARAREPIATFKQP